MTGMAIRHVLSKPSSIPAARSQRLFGLALMLTISTSPSVP